MTVKDLSDGLIAKSVDSEHLGSLREDLRENDDVLALVEGETDGEVTVILSLVDLVPPGLEYIQ